MAITKTCVGCGAEFESPSSRRRFCTSNCYDTNGRTRPKTKKVHTFTCSGCGETFTTDKKNAASAKRKALSEGRSIYCTLPCYGRNGSAMAGRAGGGRPRTAEQIDTPHGPRSVYPHDGYRMVRYPEHSTKKGGLILEHRLVMELHLGRTLLPGETVHHANGVTTDNRLENLELWASGQPAGQRVTDKVAWARALLAEYEPLGY